MVRNERFKMKKALFLLLLMTALSCKQNPYIREIQNSTPIFCSGTKTWKQLFSRSHFRKVKWISFINDNGWRVVRVIGRLPQGTRHAEISINFFITDESYTANLYLDNKHKPDEVLSIFERVCKELGGEPTPAEEE